MDSKTTTNEESAALPWGDETLTLDFPGGPYTFYGLSETQASDLRGRFQNYCVEASVDQTFVPVKVTRGADTPHTQVILGSGEYSLDLVHEQNMINVQGLRFFGSADFRPMTRAMISTPVNEPEKTWSIFENFLRLLVAHRLLDGNGLILHSAAIVIAGGAYLFYGVSGAGKSTLSEMAAKAGYEIISDDLNAIEFCKEQVQVRKLPFTGAFAESTCSREAYPLHGVYRLEHAEFNSIKEPSVAVAMASLLACAPYVNTSGVILEQLQNRLLQIFDHVRPGVLSFSNTCNFDEISTLLNPIND